MSKFKTGDVVMLKSSKQPMTVETTESSQMPTPVYYRCVWWPQFANGEWAPEPRRGSFPEDCLVVVE